MNAAPSITGFRLRVLIGMMLVVCAVTALALWIAQHKVSDDARRELRQAFQSEIDAQHRAREIRNAALTERSRSLVRRPRIHAALEDDALDLLYPSAEDELRDVTEGGDDAEHPLHARFYRFLDATGAVITAPPSVNAGNLSKQDEARLSLEKSPETQQLGYLVRGDGVDEIITAPIISSETGEVIASIVLGFKPFEPGARSLGLKSGILIDGQLRLADITAGARAQLASAVTKSGEQSSVLIDGAPHLIFTQLLNPRSLFPPATEVCLYPLAGALARERQLRRQILGAGVVLLIGALGASHFISGKLSAPVEKLAVDSAQNLAQREVAEAALEQTSAELRRSMRFSADASHQLKTPVSVLRAGLEELRAGAELTPEAGEEVSTLIHQTFRLTSMIEDLLLLSRLDAGRLHIEYQPLDISRLIEAMIDDLSAMPDAAEMEVEADMPAGFFISGDRRYTTIILQNLLENARKYNRPDGRIRITAREADGEVIITVGNTGVPVPPGAREHIFERFHRGARAENVPGHGLGLNLARELARNHGGDLVLAGSEDDWTEFELRLRVATIPAPA